MCVDYRELNKITKKDVFPQAHLEKIRKKRRRKFKGYVPAEKRIEKMTFQAHCVLGNISFDNKHPKRIVMVLLNNILGGPGMNSRLNLALRERRGYSYSAESHYAPYTDTGAMMIYFSSDKEKFDLSMGVVGEEIKKLRTNLISDNRLKHARKQLMGQLAISYENNEHLMLTSGKRFLVFNRVDSLDTIRNNLEEITARGLRDTAHEILDPMQMNTLIFE